MKRLPYWLISLSILGTLAACASRPPVRTSVEPPASVQPAEVVHERSRWTPVPWSELPGWHQDSLPQAWRAWLRSCESPATALASLCTEVRQLAAADPSTQRRWLMERLQPYRIEALNAAEIPLLTGYYEPVLEASRVPRGDFTVALHRPPATLRQGKPWYSRKEMDLREQAKAALRGREIAYVAHPADLLTLQIQGSGRLLVHEVNGERHMVRLSYAGTNNQPYRSVGRWLLNRGELREASWPSIRGWMTRNPGRVQEMMWSNPRVVFFREEVLADDPTAGPVGAQGVPLTAGRSIAVDPASIPYGTPVWLVSSGRYAQLNRLVLAQDTGSAIRGAVRADYFTGAGSEAAELAGRLKQPLQMWALWPR